MFVNFSNHPSNKWSDDQLKAAREYGDILDMAFPVVDPNGDEAYVGALADEYAGRIMELAPHAVLCQGEFTLAFAVVSRLKAAGVPVVAACSRRDVTEVERNGEAAKISVFRFVRFRGY